MTLKKISYPPQFFRIFLLLTLLATISSGLASTTPLIRLVDPQRKIPLRLRVRERRLRQTIDVLLRQNPQRPQEWVADYPFTLDDGHDIPTPRFRKARPYKRHRPRAKLRISSLRFYAFHIIHTSTSTSTTDHPGRYIFDLEKTPRLTHLQAQQQERQRAIAAAIGPLRPRQRELLLFVESLVQRQQFTLAEEVLKMHLSAYPDDVGIKLRLVQLYHHSSHPQQALLLLQELQKSHPHWLPHTLLAHALLMQEQGEKDLLALAQNPQVKSTISRQAAHSLAQLYLHRGESLKARQYLQQVQQLSSPQSAEPEHQQATGQLDLLQRHQALELTQQKKFLGYIHWGFLEWDTNVVSLNPETDYISHFAGFANSLAAFVQTTLWRRQQSSWSAGYSVSALYHPDPSLIKYDTWTHSFLFPYTTAGHIFQRPTQFTTTADFSLQAAEWENRKVPARTIQSRSFAIDHKMQILLNEKNIFTGSGQLRSLSLLHPEERENDASGIHMELAGRYLAYLNSGRQRYWDLSTLVAEDFTRGNNYDLFTYSLTLGYGNTLGKQFTHRISMQGLWKKFPHYLENRQEQLVQCQWVLSRPLGPQTFFTQSIAGIQNFSTINNHDYQRLIIASSLQYEF